MLQVTHSRSEVTSIRWRLSWNNKRRNKHITTGQSGINTFWKQPLICMGINWKSLASLTKDFLGRKKCNRKSDPAPQEREK